MTTKNSIPSIPKSDPSDKSDQSVKFTPGPWQRKGRLIIPKIQEDENNHEIVCRIHENRFTSREEANAALIAAAPEMFTALMEVLNWYNAFTPHATGRMFVPDDMIEKVLKAIQKARGEQ